MGKVVDVRGQKFNMLTAIEQAPQNIQHKTAWICRCDCGNTVTVRNDHLRFGSTFSCGCYRIKACGDRMRRHGMSFTPTHVTWASMWNRCTNPNADSYDRYGGAGITICDRWKVFKNFLEDMGARPKGKTIDRYPDPAGNYEPTNCRWATHLEQSRNRKNTIWLTVGGINKRLVEHAEDRGMSAFTIYERLAAGMSPEEALTKPVRKRRDNRRA